MSLIINLYGGPSSGKTTTSLGLTALLKEDGVNAELIQEYVKQWAWEKRVPVNYDQFYIFGKQSRKEYSLFKEVDVLVSESPIALVSYYTHLYGTHEQDLLFRVMTKTYYEMVKNEGHEILNFWINRVKPYDTRGRYQTEDQAKEIDYKLKSHLEDLNIVFDEKNSIDGDSLAKIKIQQIILDHFNKNK